MLTSAATAGLRLWLWAGAVEVAQETTSPAANRAPAARGSAERNKRINGTFSFTPADGNNSTGRWRAATVQAEESTLPVEGLGAGIRCAHKSGMIVPFL